MKVLLMLFCIVEAIENNDQSCNRSVVYHVASLQQSNHCCQNVSLDKGEIGDLKSQFAALQNKVLLLQNKLEKHLSDCVEQPLINGVNPLKDNQLSASTTHPGCSMPRSRLHTREDKRSAQPWAGSWCALTNTDTQWIQVDFGRIVEVTAIATQGRNSGIYVQRITSYTLSLSEDGSVWRVYTENDVIKVFGGNLDSDTVNKNHLKTPVTTRYLRLHPKSWNNHVSLRWEVYGCPK